MNFVDSALTAAYPVIIFLGVMIVLRFAPILRKVDAPIRTLICSQLTMVGGIMWEQVMYGYGRVTGKYITIATSPGLVSIGKITFICGMIYMLYAFWMLSPVKPRLIVPFTMAFTVWAMLTGALML